MDTTAFVKRQLKLGRIEISERIDDGMELKNTNAAGSVKISEEVVSTVVKTILDEIEGVHSLAVKPVSPSEVLLKSAPLKSISIALNADVAVIDIALNLCSGFKVKQVAEQVQLRIKDAVQDMTGITVSKVNVYIVGLRAS